MTAYSRPPLPRDLQARLDVILAKPVLRRVPALAQAIEILVRNAYERLPSQDVLVIDDDQLKAAASDRAEMARRLEELAALCQRATLPIPRPGAAPDFSKILIGNSDTGNDGYERKDGVL